MIILGIESSCDETAAAVLKDGKLISSFVATQDEVHAKYGGVVPELASRRHIESIIPLINGALTEAQIKLSDIDAVAVTYAPGLVGSLLIGLSTAKAIAYSLNKPLVGVNHLEGHLNAAFLEYDDIPYPHIGLVVSGGHTSLYLVKKIGDYKLLGATRDDAAGEAFDKVAKLLSLGYPGGPVIDKLADKGNASAFKFTRPKFDKGEFDFSFSGVKTAVLYYYQNLQKEGKFTEQTKLNLIASFQSHVVRIICERLIAAAQKYKCKAIIISGGVAANKHLRGEIDIAAKAAGVRAYTPSIKFCTDNAAMIAYVGWQKLKNGKTDPLNLNAQANEEIGV